jgi:hypothetical protein
VLTVGLPSQVDLAEPHYALIAECLPANRGQLLSSLAVVPAAMLVLKPRIAIRGLTSRPADAKPS